MGRKEGRAKGTHPHFRPRRPTFPVLCTYGAPAKVACKQGCLVIENGTDVEATATRVMDTTKGTPFQSQAQQTGPTHSR